MCNPWQHLHCVCFLLFSSRKRLHFVCLLLCSPRKRLYCVSVAIDNTFTACLSRCAAFGNCYLAFVPCGTLSNSTGFASACDPLGNSCSYTVLFLVVYFLATVKLCVFASSSVVISNLRIFFILVFLIV